MFLYLSLFCFQAGASLESLAKGAVQFSRRFTVRELQDRWFSLLYDPVVSAEASTCMNDLEHSASTLPSKFNKFANSKENKSVSGKRKVESVRSCYYALRKRICNEPFNSMDLSFLVVPDSSNFVVNGDEHLSANCTPGDPMSNPFGFEGSDMDAIHNAFPQNMIDSGDVAVNTCHLGVQNPVAEDFPIEQNNTHNEIPHIFGENLTLEDLGQSKELPVCDFLKDDELGMKSPSAFDHINSDQPNMCSKFEGNKVFNSPITECGASFSSLDYSSPLPGMSMWRTVSAPALPVDIGLKDNDLCSGGSFELPDDYDAKNTGTSGYDVPLDIKVKTEMDLDDLKGDNNPEVYLEELSNSLWNFTNDEELQDMFDKSYYDGLSSLLLNSPNDVGQDNMNDITEAEISVAPDVCITSTSGAYPGELDGNEGSHNVDGQMSYSSETKLQSSILASSLQFPELKDGVINCTLNTEDTEIPCNDDIFLSNHLSQAMMASTAEQKFQQANDTISSSPKDFSGIQKTSDRGPSLIHKERNAPRKSHASFQILEPNLQEIGLKLPLGNFGVKFEVSESPHVASRAVGIASGDPDQIITENVRTKTSPVMYEDSKEIVFEQHLTSTDRFIEKQDFDSESFQSYPQNASGIKEESDVSVLTRDHRSTPAEVASMNVAVPKPALNPPMPEQDGMLIESDDDVPCYSDIEAMVNSKMLSILLIGVISIYLFVVSFNFSPCRYLIWTWIQMTKTCMLAKKVT